MTIVLQQGPVRAEVDPERGARLVSLRFGEHEVLGHADDVAAVGESIGVGSYPMVPWAGRIGGGVLVHAGTTHHLPLEAEGNALHGLGRDLTWIHDGSGGFTTRVGDPWPEPGEARLSYAVRSDGLDVALEWRPDVDTGCGCTLGLHPWFRREIAGVPVVPDVRPATMVERGADGLPTGRVVDPASPPWDDCFGLVAPPRLSWPGVLDLELTSTAPWWVLYTEPAGAVCVEPQTRPPDAWAHPALAAGSVDRLELSITA